MSERKRAAQAKHGIFDYVPPEFMLIGSGGFHVGRTPLVHIRQFHSAGDLLEFFGQVPHLRLDRRHRPM